ncbi:MAG: GTP-binding protein [Candidatus Aenigmatarchaeota archaeon]|nr:GTP-binding protein [Nanoarchaeota archaeon]
MGVQEEIENIEDELKRTKYNKATQGHIGKLKAKLAKLRTEQTKSSGKKGVGYSIKKSGDATVILVGFPSVGKSSLLNKLTNAESKVGAYDFTTLDVIPGVLEYNNTTIQMLDVPGLITEASAGKGRGKEIMSVIRNADVLLIIAAGENEEKIIRQVDLINQELYNGGFRLNKERPDVRIYKKNFGGVRVDSTVKLTKMGISEVRSVLNEFGIYNADILIRENITSDELIDAIMTNRVYIPSLVVVNKIDKFNPKKLPFEYIGVSATDGENIDKLKEIIWKRLDVIRIYLKKIGKEPDMEDPIIFRKSVTVEGVCKKIHQKFLDSFRYARIWGSSKFPGQKIGLEYTLKDKDIVELHM